MRLLHIIVAVIGTLAVFFVALGVLQAWDMDPVVRGLLAVGFSAVTGYLIFSRSGDEA